LGIEATQALDLLVEQVDTHGRVRAYSVYVQKRAADREFARLDHLLYVQVSMGDQCVAQPMCVEALADPHGQ
jgi:hypothetical protein